ncbi:CDP-diacylglycerol--serine O-phosphatidyltransferase [Basidiobolus meristosporus CBS 931.73]|uniref:CDP-diacylglycerol--serine O-phosphatidyltransferase n=1 Tax=Basidiobolus meristosporus CBS 931.73 TaxID=1314790 RepID=A0A1Y1WP80_9FUNG|nr:CDP-diacylglycerol--serine O-phosphatidyltransferase [Basidiobolus meristosporus CBS 931.73]|eukprot:ORX75351.1 CDP-diacylglycerol--serine O-phosphatidyltransferase [Basidiobolus meristosporus CBS 931.73]
MSTLRNRLQTSEQHSTPASSTVEYLNNHFNLVREFHLADFLTLLNGTCGTGSIFASMSYLIENNTVYLWVAFWLIPLGTFFDFMDGRVARWRKNSSLLGQELDSLADLISFGVAPAVFGFTLGLRSVIDICVLLYFVSCGIARLARYNATVASLPKDESGKVKHFEGTPIPTTLLITGYLGYLVYVGDIQTALPGGVASLANTLTFHPLVLGYALSGTLMISQSLKIPKI